tara:strand:- start:278 stop:1288 length:1011 start_codon:yes stop_codon:yes gene_type:complete
MRLSTVISSIDLACDGKAIGDLRIKWSDNSIPLGYHLVPIISIRNGLGPIILMISGTHGDEFEGPSALMRLSDQIDVKDISGQIIIIPALNASAIKESSRVSPLDRGNLNRAFPGNPTGDVTQQIAYYIETELLPKVDAVIDLHSGGKASFFSPCTLATRTKDKTLYKKNVTLAKVFGLPLIWVLGDFNDSRSLNSAAARVGIPMIATELGGGGGVDPSITNTTEKGLYNLLKHIGIFPQHPDTFDSNTMVEIVSNNHSVISPGEGIFDRKVSAGDIIKKGQLAGQIHYTLEPRRDSENIFFNTNGIILAHTNRGYVKRGDMLLLVVQEIDNIDIF